MQTADRQAQRYFYLICPLQFERETGSIPLLGFQPLAQISKGFLFWQTMIGIFKTTDKKTGLRIIIRYTRVNSRVRITSICDAAGNDIFGRFTSEELQFFKADIAQLAQ